MPTEIPNQTHTNKYSIPDALDNGIEIADTIEEFMIAMANHSHNGVDSRDMSLAIDKDIAEFDPSLWAEVVGKPGLHESDAILVPGTKSYDDTARVFMVEVSAGNFAPAYLHTEKVTDTTYKILTNDISSTIRVITF